MSQRKRAKVLVGEFPSESSTLGEARLWVRRNARSGIDCPCCAGVVKVYLRHVSPVVAQGLVLMWRYSQAMTGGVGWVAVGKFYKQMHAKGVIRGKDSGGDYAKSRWWGIIEPRLAGQAGQVEEAGTRVSGKRGEWSITQFGHEFILGKVKIPCTARICMNELLEMEGPHVGIVDILGAARHEEMMHMSVPWDEWGGRAWWGGG